MKLPMKRALREYLLNRTESLVVAVTYRFKVATVEQMTRMRLLMEIGMRVGAGDAVFDRKRREWHVPILCAPNSRDAQGTPPTNVGTAVLDSRLNWVSFPTRDEIGAVLEEADRGKHEESFRDWVARRIRDTESSGPDSA